MKRLEEDIRKNWIISDLKPFLITGIKYFYNISVEFEGQEVYELWLEWIDEVNVTISYNTELTIKEKLIEIWASLQAFLSVHTEIQETIYFIYIEEWGGYVRNIEAVTVAFRISKSEKLVELDESGDCELFEYLRNGTSAEWETQVETLISEITVILEGDYSYAYKLVLIYEKIQAFFQANSGAEEQLLQIEFGTYGTFYSFYELTAYYWRVYNFDLAVGGSSSQLIQVLTASYQNTSTGSVSVRSQIKQLTEKISAYYETTTDVTLRVQYFYAQLYQFYILNEWTVNIIYSLEIQGYGDLYQLIYAYVLDLEIGFDFTLPTTTEETTIPTTTTTKKPVAQCSEVTQINEFSSNTTDLLTSIVTAQASWNSSEISNFLAYKKRIYVVSSNTTATLEEKYNSIVLVLTKWTTNTFYLNLVYQINIIQWGGTVKQAINCQSAVDVQ
uniref:Egg protein n=1 Tax=Bursaphelenchus xylophilus TaxID=6326 RepID=A0A1I7RJ62_BURXY